MYVWVYEGEPTGFTPILFYDRQGRAYVEAEWVESGWASSGSLAIPGQISLIEEENGDHWAVLAYSAEGGDVTPEVYATLPFTLLENSDPTYSSEGE